MSYDPHQNVFFFYRGPKSRKEHEGVDFQLENNTTKALINTLYYSDPNVCKDFISHFLKISIDDSTIKYTLQKQTIGTQKIQQKKNRILLGICPQLLSSEKDLVDSNEEIFSKLDLQDSIPDAWIWDKDNAILIESKTRMKFDKDQLRRHEAILSSPTDKRIIYWEEIHSFFKDNIEKEPFIIKQFVQYLELINLSNFSGWKKEDFEFFFIYDESEKIRMKNKLKKFALEIIAKKEISEVLEIVAYSRVGKESVNIWVRLDSKDPKFKLSNQVDAFINFTLELYANHFQVSFVFPFFPSIKKLKRLLIEKESTIINQFESLFSREIIDSFSHDKLKEMIKYKTRNIMTIPYYKIRIFDHCFVKRGDRYWLPRAEMTIDAQTLYNHEWFEFLKRYITLYHPKDSKRDSGWGAGLHILKQYPRGCEILEKPKELIKDVQSTLLNFYKFGQTFVN